MGSELAEAARVFRGAARENRPYYRLLAELFRASIANGELPPGTRLPSERDLAAAASVSRATVVAAYNLLRADSLVEMRHGLGTWVSGSPP